MRDAKFVKEKTSVLLEISNRVRAYVNKTIDDSIVSSDKVMNAKSVNNLLQSLEATKDGE